MVTWLFLVVFLLLMSPLYTQNQSLEWDEEPVEVQGGSESPLLAYADLSEQNLDKREGTPVENEWDRLLRVR